MVISACRRDERMGAMEFNLGKFKIPRSVVFVEALPHTPTGKILKRVLREEHNA